MGKFLVVCLLLFVEAAAVANTQSAEPNYCYQLAACLMFQNEAEHLKEWIEYHRLIGFEHFYLFNNRSTDDYKKVLKPYIKKKIVELFDAPDKSNNQPEYLRIQISIYRAALAMAYNKVKWLAFIDADEYIVPLQTDSLLEALKEYEGHGGIYINWLNFGTSQVEKIPKNALLVEMLTHCADSPMRLGKSIVRVERVKKCTDPHRLFYTPPYTHVNSNHQVFGWRCPIAEDKLLIFHYYTGDIDHLKNIKFPRRKKWADLDFESYVNGLDHLNARLNTTMERFIPKLRNRVFSKRNLH